MSCSAAGRGSGGENPQDMAAEGAVRGHKSMQLVYTTYKDGTIPWYDKEERSGATPYA